ncbi:MAG TPA: hypothetical protein VJ828_04015, partial [Lacipirellulaceae bacterium]|nr:hypothetical protein [Lacipirellulaceae bacterium]
MRVQRMMSFLVVICAACGPLRQCVAAPVTWVGGNGTWSDGIANDANWNPADEPDIDDEAIFNSANSVNLGSANTVEALTMSGGIDLSANGFGLTVDGLAQLIDAGTNLNIEGA